MNIYRLVLSQNIYCCNTKNIYECCFRTYLHRSLILSFYRIFFFLQFSSIICYLFCFVFFSFCGLDFIYCSLFLEFTFIILEKRIMSGIFVLYINKVKFYANREVLLKFFYLFSAKLFLSSMSIFVFCAEE